MGKGGRGEDGEMAGFGLFGAFRSSSLYRKVLLVSDPREGLDRGRGGRGDLGVRGIVNCPSPLLTY